MIRLFKRCLIRQIRFECADSLVKWRKKTLESRKQNLNISRQALRNLCETELNKLHPRFTAPALVEFGKVNVEVCV
jgi:hypothetical protein